QPRSGARSEAGSLRHPNLAPPTHPLKASTPTSRVVLVSYAAHPNQGSPELVCAHRTGISRVPGAIGYRRTVLGEALEAARSSAPPVSSESTTTRASPRGRLGRADGFAVGILLGIPLFAFSVAALAGYPLLTGDDVTQNYPLSVLAGQFIAHGHLPVYDPYLWAGTPLLAGANAHALLPTTLLFAFLPH